MNTIKQNDQSLTETVYTIDVHIECRQKLPEVNHINPNLQIGTMQVNLCENRSHSVTSPVRILYQVRRQNLVETFKV